MFGATIVPPVQQIWISVREISNVCLICELGQAFVDSWKNCKWDKSDRTKHDDYGDGKDNINDQWQDHRWWWRRQEWWQVAVCHVGRMFAGVVHWAEDAHDFRNMLRHDDQNEKELSTMGALQHFTIHYHKRCPVVWQTYIKCEHGGGNPEDLESAAFEKRRIDPAVTKMHKQMETTKKHNRI